MKIHIKKIKKKTQKETLNKFDTPHRSLTHESQFIVYFMLLLFCLGFVFSIHFTSLVPRVEVVISVQFLFIKNLLLVWLSLV